MLHQETGRPCRSMIAVAALGPMLAALLLLPPAGLQAAMAAAAQGASVTAPQRATHAAAPVPPSATRAAVPVLPPATRPTAPTTRPASPATAPAARPAEARASGASRATICTQNLWNYGLPKQVRALRYPKESLTKVRARLSQQEAVFARRFAACDVVAVQELVGGDDAHARAALERLSALLGKSSKHRWAARIADTHDAIRTGFLVRMDGRLHEKEFLGSHTDDRFPRIEGYPEGRWDRGPAEIVLEAGENGKPARIRIIDAHLKSKLEREGEADPNGERWERRRVVQARALLDLARSRIEKDPSEMVLVAGDFNSGRGSATRAVLGGLIDPPALISPRDCIDPEGMIACKLPEHSPFLVDLAGDDPDLRGQGSYRFGGKEEMIDGIFAASAAARAAREPGHAANDWDVTLIGRFFQGSDHRMLRVRLRF